jgi:hypothetical protein
MSLLTDAEIRERAELVAGIARSGAEAGEAILLLCSAIAMISNAAELSDHGTRAAVDSAMHHMLPR